MIHHRFIAATGPGRVARTVLGGRRLVGSPQPGGTGARRSPVPAPGVSAEKPVGASLFSERDLPLVLGHLDHHVQCQQEQVRPLPPLRPFVVALLQRLDILFLRACPGRRNEQARLDRALVVAHLIAQRVAVVDVQVRHDLTRIFSADEAAKGGGFLPLLAVVEALQQVAKVVVPTDSLLGKTLTLSSVRSPPVAGGRRSKRKA